MKRSMINISDTGKSTAGVPSLKSFKTKNTRLKHLSARLLSPGASLFLIGVILLVACNKYSGPGGSFGVTDYRSDGGPETTVGNIDRIVENSFIKTEDSAITTFSVDADGGSYAVTRKLLENGMDLKSYKHAIRTEEYINYFTYNYNDPTDDNTIAVNGEVSACPWNTEHKLVRIGIKGKPVSPENCPPANFVLLIDVSGSMSGDDRLELLKKGFTTFVRQMRNTDRIAIVTYAGNESLALESTPGTQKDKIMEAIGRLGSGGSTNGAGGIRLAYEIANKNFIAGGNNRVIIGTDGDFNVGITNTDELVKLVEEQKSKGVFLTTLGVGLGNYNESMMERIANKGDGNYEYLDNEKEINKVFIDEYSKFITVAKDVKIQVTFNKEVIEAYRLIGYENRALANSDFEDDKKDAGEIGAGQTITAIYEVRPKINPQYKSVPAFSINFRYKKSGDTNSIPLSLDIYDRGTDFSAASEDMRFAGSLAALGMHLRNSAYQGTITLDAIKSWADQARSFDPNGYRLRHMELLEKIK